MITISKLIASHNNLTSKYTHTHQLIILRLLSLNRSLCNCSYTCFQCDSMAVWPLWVRCFCQVSHRQWMQRFEIICDFDWGMAAKQCENVILLFFVLDFWIRNSISQIYLCPKPMNHWIILCFAIELTEQLLSILIASSARWVRCGRTNFFSEWMNKSCV